MRATFGIIAGCSMATSLIRAHALDAFDTAPRSVNLHSIDRDSSEFSSFDAYIDDTSISAIGSRSYVRDTIVNMASLLLAGIRQMLGGRVALDKVALVCSCDSLGQQLEADLGPFGCLSSSAVNLGCDDTAGKGFRLGKGRLRKRKERKLKMIRKAKRLKRMRSHFGRKAVKVFSSGPLPGYIYGCEVQGLSDGEVHGLRRVAASVLKPSAARRSLTVLSRLEGDPVWYGSVAPVLRYVKEIWLLRAQLFSGTLDWDTIRRSWEGVFVSRQRSITWRKVSGPMSAMYMSLRRIG